MDMRERNGNGDINIERKNREMVKINFQSEMKKMTKINYLSLRKRFIVDSNFNLENEKKVFEDYVLGIFNNLGVEINPLFILECWEYYLLLLCKYSNGLDQVFWEIIEKLIRIEELKKIYLEEDNINHNYNFHIDVEQLLPLLKKLESVIRIVAIDDDNDDENEDVKNNEMFNIEMTLYRLLPQVNPNLLKKVDAMVNNSILTKLLLIVYYYFEVMRYIYDVDVEDDEEVDNIIDNSYITFNIYISAIFMSLLLNQIKEELHI